MTAWGCGRKARTLWTYVEERLVCRPWNATRMEQEHCSAQYWKNTDWWLAAQLAGEALQLSMETHIAPGLTI
eukprot:3595076-Pyramimonas_sp.AAC.1